MKLFATLMISMFAFFVFGAIQSAVFRGSYTADDGTLVEIAGICKLTESSVTCWNTEGNAAPDVQRLFETAFARTSRGNIQIGLHYGAKNRAIVIKTTGESRKYNIRPITDRPDAIHASYLNLNDPNIDLKDSPKISYQTLNLYFEPNATSTSVDLTQRSFDFKKATSKLKIGSTFSLGEKNVKVVKQIVVKPNVLSWQQFPRWDYPLEFEGAIDDLEPDGCIALDKSGVRINKLNEVGRPLTKKEEMESVANYRRLPPILDFPSAQTFLYIRKQNRQVTISTNINPKYIGELQIWAVKTKTVRIEGIPLDPKTN